MKKLGFTLVEMIVVIVITGILCAGTFVSLKHLYQRVAKSKALSELSFDSQIVVDQISALLYDRVPNSIYGYKKNQTNKTKINNIINDDYKILEWSGTLNEALKAGYYSGFVDMDDSNKSNNEIRTYDINVLGIRDILEKKFDINDETKLGVIFAGAFDTGEDINISNIDSINVNGIVLSNKPNEIYEKYYIVDSSYVIARGEDINCIDTNETNSLYLIYNYRPWNNNEKICSGSVAILSKEAKGFEVGIVNDSIYFNLTLSRHINGVEQNVTISKQKVVL